MPFDSARETGGAPAIFPASVPRRVTIEGFLDDRRKVCDMRELKLIRSESDHLVLATDAGETFTLPIDDSLRAELRRSRAETTAAPASKASPREIQSHIRAGMSSSDVADLLGTTVEDVERFEAPVLAERAHIVGLALAVPVLIAGVDENDPQPTFGDAIRAKLADAGATGENWTSWKDASGWTVCLEFTIGEVAHDARWGFDPRRSSLSPANTYATQLSRQGSLPEGLIPRLRALDNRAESPSVLKDEARFDSGAFGPRAVSPTRPSPAPAAAPEADESARSAPAASSAAIKRAPEVTVTSAETADLLEALRRRRGQREPAPSLGQSSTGGSSAAGSASAARATSPIALFDEPDAAIEPATDDEPAQPSPASETTGDQSAVRRRGGRSALPSWDEIVFGARTDSD